MAGAKASGAVRPVLHYREGLKRSQGFSARSRNPKCDECAHAWFTIPRYTDSQKRRRPNEDRVHESNDPFDAYSWTDPQPTCEILLDFRDEVLARLELNKQCAEEERLSGAAAEAKEKKGAKRPVRKATEQKDRFQE